MAILAFQKPDKVLCWKRIPNSVNSNSVLLEPGFGITVGNALRRISFLHWKVLLSTQSVLKVLSMNF